MTQTRQTLEEVDLIFDNLSSIIIQEDIRQFQPELVPLPERVIAGSHQEDTDSWSSSSPSLLFETQQPPMVFQTIPITPDGLIDPHTIQNLFIQNKLPCKTIDQFCVRMGINLINRPEPRPDESTIWVQIAHVLPEQKDEINKEWFSHTLSTN
jgi:hypothetical protein